MLRFKVVYEHNEKLPDTSMFIDSKNGTIALRTAEKKIREQFPFTFDEYSLKQLHQIVEGN